MVGRRAWYLAAGVAVLVLLCVVCIGLGWAQGRRGNSFARVRDVHQRHTGRLLAIRGVVGTAVGEAPDGASEIKVFAKDPDVVDVPEELEGVPVTVEVTGEFIALAKPAAKAPGPKLTPTSTWPRPVPIGVSTGNEYEISAGTISCRVVDGAGNVYALSNNHVYALENRAPLGSRVLQPGRYDTRRYQVLEANVIGHLFDWERIVLSETASNLIDAAIADSNVSLLSNSTPPDGYGTPLSTTVPASVRQSVQKYGRTTRLTKGSVDAINATLKVSYSSGTARFVDQIIVKAPGFIKPGDSGSLLVTDPDRAPVGLLFAGNPDGSYAIANRIDLVLDAFGVEVDGE